MLYLRDALKHFVKEMNSGDTKRHLENMLRVHRKLYKISPELQWMSTLQILLYISCGVKHKE